MAEISSTSLVFILLGCIAWVYAILQCLLFMRCCGRCKDSDENSDPRWTRRGLISASVPASAPRSAPLHVAKQDGFSYDRFVASVAAFDLTKRVLGEIMDETKTVEDAVSNNQGDSPSLPVVDSELQRQLSLLEEYFQHTVHTNTPPTASTKLLVRRGASLMSTPVMQQQSTFCVPCAFLWVGLALWPWVLLQEDCVAANEADCDSEASASANEIAFIVMAAIFGCCSCFFLMADMEFLSRVRPWSEYAARLNKLTQLGDTPQDCKVGVSMSWRAQHPSGEVEGDKPKFVGTATGRVNITDDTGLQFVTRSVVADMGQLEAQLKTMSVPGAYVHLCVEFVPRGLAARYLSSIRTLGAALGSRVDSHFESDIVLSVYPDAAKSKAGSDKDMKLLTGGKVQSTLVLRSGVSKETMASYVEPFGCFHPFPRFFLQLITLALGLNTLIAGWNTRKLPQAVVTLRKELWLARDPSTPPEPKHAAESVASTERSAVDPSAAGSAAAACIPGLPPGVLPAAPAFGSSASAPTPHGFSQVTVKHAGGGSMYGASASPYLPPTGSDAGLPHSPPPSTALQATGGVSQTQVAAWQAMLPPPAYGGGMFSPFPADSGAPPPPYYSAPPAQGPASRVTQAFGLSWTPPPGEAGDFYV